MTKIDAANNNGRRIVATVDHARRTATGPDADRLLFLADRAGGVVYLYGTQQVPISDPLGSPEQLALLLAGNGYDPGDLASLLPPPEQVPEGAIA